MLIRRLFILLSAVVLFGCAGSVHRDNNALKSTFAADSVNTVEIKMTEEALKLQEDNSQFSSKDLLSYLERKLDGKNLLKSDSSYRLQVTISQFRARSSFSAMMFGFMAGADSIDGKVRVFDQAGKQVHSFDVSASYALGGIAGGDGTRMNWLYDKFADLTIAELTGTTDGTSVKQEIRKEVQARKERTTGTASADRHAGDIARNPGNGIGIGIGTREMVMAKPSARHDFTLPEDSHFALVTDTDAIPYVNQRARESYALYLTRGNPRAYVIAPDGSWAYRVGRDALSNALSTCESKHRTTCYPYAIDSRIVWQSDGAAREALRKKLLAEIVVNQDGDTLVQKT